MDKGAWGGGQRIQTIAVRFFLVELGEMMCEKKPEVKQGLPPSRGGGLVASELDAAGLDGFGKSAADEAEGRGRGIALGLKG